MHARIGMEDPADTGRIWGLVGPLGMILSETDIRLEPVFDDTCLCFRAAARVRLIPGQLMALLLGFLLSPAVLRAAVQR